MAAIFPTIAAAAAAAMMMMMSLVSWYDDGSGFCTGIQNRARCNPSQLPMPNSTVAQRAIPMSFRHRAMGGSPVCARLHIMEFALEGAVGAVGLDVYCYFTCNLEYCQPCYDKAFKWLMQTDGSGCPGNAGAYISLDDGCCLRYEIYNFCGALN